MKFYHYSRSITFFSFSASLKNWIFFPSLNLVMEKWKLMSNWTNWERFVFFIPLNLLFNCWLLQNKCVFDQAWGQHGWIIGRVLFFFSFFAFLWTENRSKFIKTEKKNQANTQPSWPHAWSIKDVLFSKKITALLRMKTCLFREAGKKVNCVCSRINPRVSFLFSLFWFSSAAFCDCVAVIVRKLRTLNLRSKLFVFWFFLRGSKRAIPSG